MEVPPVSRRRTKTQPPPKSHLHIEGPSSAAELVVLDGALNRVARTVGKFDDDVLPGLYRVAARLGNAAEQQYVEVKLAGPAVIRQDQWTVQFAAASPLDGTSTSREAHQEPAEIWSRNLTFRQSQGPARLFLFARSVAKAAKPSLHEGRWKSMALFNAAGEEITAFSDGHVVSNSELGWMAFTADLKEGAHKLRLQCRSADGEARAIEFPLWLSDKFETQAFLTWTDETSSPLISLSMPRKGVGFVAFDRDRQREDRIAELAINGLQRGKNLIVGMDLRALLTGKFKNPWLGIIGAHCLMLDSTPPVDPLGIVCRNLTKMLGDHPDVLALRLAAGEKLKNLRFPPVLRAGMAIVLEQSTRRKSVVETGSLLDSISLAMIPNGPWTSWCPDRLSRRPETVQSSSSDIKHVTRQETLSSREADIHADASFRSDDNFLRWLGITRPVSSNSWREVERILVRMQRPAEARRLAPALNVSLSTAEMILQLATSGATPEQNSREAVLLEQAKAYWRRDLENRTQDEEQFRRRDLLDVVYEESRRYLSVTGIPRSSLQSVLILQGIVEWGRTPKESPFIILYSRSSYWAHPSIAAAVVKAVLLDPPTGNGEGAVRLDQQEGGKIIPLWVTGVGSGKGPDVSYKVIWIKLPDAKATNGLCQAVAELKSKQDMNTRVTKFRSAVRLAQASRDDQLHQLVEKRAEALIIEFSDLI
jgi:hypothetical protein